MARLMGGFVELVGEGLLDRLKGLAELVGCALSRLVGKLLGKELMGKVVGKLLGKLVGK